MLDEDRRTAIEAFAALRIEAPVPSEIERAAYLEGRKARLVVFLLGWMGLLSLAEVFVGGWLVDYISRLHEGVAGTAEVGMLERLSLGLVWVRVFSGVVTGVAFIQWLRAVVRHAWHFGLHDADMPFTVESSTWAWFVPIINLFRPYSVMRAVRAVSRPEVLPSYEVEERAVPGGYRDRPLVRERLEPSRARIPLALWWGLFLGARLAQRFLPPGAEVADLSTMRRFAYIGLIDGALWAAAALAAIYLVRGVVDHRTELYRRAFHWARILRGEDAPER